MVHLLKHKHSFKKYQDKAKEEPTFEEEKKAEHTTIDRNHCPRCGGLLVKRHGPFGDFYGCKNYPAINCKYTRRIK